MTKLPTSLTPFAKQGDDEVTTAARGLEAHFLRQMLAEVRESSDGSMLDGGFAGSTFKEMLDGALSDNMAKAGGLGLTKMLTKEMSKAQGKEGGAGKSGLSGLQMAPGLRSSVPLKHEAAAAHAPAVAPSINDDQTPNDLDAWQTPLSAPGTGAVTSQFGTRHDPLEGDTRMHAGVDLRAPTGTAAHAAQAGTVVRAENAGGYGNLVVVDHGNGVQSRYGHLSHIDVKPGDHVEAGEAVGEVGATGHATGPHLHFELRRNGRAIDPVQALKFFRDRSK
jgi:murein DD-endopeptidase MepM/ murein hydrolase activator NlpD